MSISQAYLGDTSDVFVLTSATLNLNFAGQDTIRSLFVNGVPQPAGTYNAGNFVVHHRHGRIGGHGLGTITADFDGNFVVDGTDLLWIQRASAPGSVYATWKTQFGTTPPVIAAVPEPSALALSATIALILAGLERRRGKA